MKVSREIFNHILIKIGEYLKKTPTNLNSAPSPTHIQLALTLHRLGYGCIYPVGADIFGVSGNLLLVKFLTMFYESWLPGCITNIYMPIYVYVCMPIRIYA